MKSLKFVNKTLTVKGKELLSNINLEIREGQNWTFLGANGSGKSRLGELIRCEWPGSCGFVSFEREKEVIERERKEDESDILDHPDPGRSASQFILEKGGDQTFMKKLSRQFRFEQLLDRGIKYLSTGELRKVLIAEELMNRPDLLILDEPYDGLDAESRTDLSELITSLIHEGIQIILLLNRFSEIPAAFENMGYLENRTLVLQGKSTELLQSEEIKRILHFHGLQDEEIPSPPADRDDLFQGNTLIRMKDVKVSYDGQDVLKDFSWKVKRTEHWKIVGPNGVGKSTLLSLISGDNPQAYANEIELFGMKKGSGESVWDIKKHIGYVSSSLQRDYRVRTTVRLVVISGFYDSIGVYSHYSEREAELADLWLKLISMDHKKNTPFQKLSFGEQRLVLIIRAMVKHPPLLILDEPCQGLDELNRIMILKMVDILAEKSGTTLLYVTHHKEDRIESIKKELQMAFPHKTFEIDLKES